MGVVNGNPAIRLYEREGRRALFQSDACEAACELFLVHARARGEDKGVDAAA